MTSKVVVTAAEDDNPEDYKVVKRIVQSVGLGPAHVDKPTAGDDPFLKTYETLKPAKLNTAVAKKAQRSNTQLQKMMQGTSSTGKKVKSKQEYLEAASGYGYLDVVQPHYNLDYLAQLFEASSTNAAAIKAKTANVVGLGYTLVESTKTKRRFDELQDDAEALKSFRKKINKIRDKTLDMLDEFNEEDDFTEILMKAYTDYEAVGMGYIEIGRGDDGVIGMVSHIPATTMRVRRERDGFVQLVAEKATFFRNFGDTTTPNPVGNDPFPNEVLVFKKYTPTNTYYGLPDIVAAKEALAGNAFAAKFNLDYFENKAVPRHLIVLKGAEFSPGAEQSIVEFFETGLRGKNHRSLYVPLPGDSPDEKVELKIEPVEAGIQDQSFQKYHDSNQAEILMAHGVPPNKVGISNGVSVASALEASRTFKDQISTPEQRRWGKKVTRIIKELTEAWVFKLNEMSLTDEDTQSKIDERNVRNSIEMANEIRARKGMPAIEKGDQTVVDLAEEERLAAEKQAKEQADQQAKATADAAKVTAEAAAKAPATATLADQKAHAKQNATGDGARGAERSAATSTTNAQGRNAKGSGKRE